MADRDHDTEKLPARVKAAEGSTHRGQLKMFLGYASGVGKSARMLDEARRRSERGEDVVVGATQPMVSPEVRELLEKLEVIPLQDLDEVQVMDVNTILTRHPQVCVVDGLAYHNHPLSYHTERWEDVEDLLEAGISILASVNLQYIDEYKDKVEQITGKRVAEVVPLKFLKSANEIEVVDAPPGMALHRGGGTPEQVALQQQKFAQLREMALLLTADIVDHQLEVYMQSHGVEQLWGTQERILVCVKAGVDARQMLESGRRNANRFRGELYAVSVRQGKRSAKDASLLEENLQYARSLDARVEVIEGEEWTAAVLRFAYEHRITQIFIHHSRNESWLERLSGSGIDRLIKSAEGIDIRVFPQ